MSKFEYRPTIFPSIAYRDKPATNFGSLFQTRPSLGDGHREVCFGGFQR